MKKLFIGLLIVAAGAATFLLLQKKDKPLTTTNLQQEKIIGQWKLDSILLVNDSNDKFKSGIMGMVDSGLRKYRYEFAKDGSIAFSLGDSLIKDRSAYEWTNENQLIWKENSNDTSGDVFKISELTNDSLILESIDSSVLLFTKVK